ncbi:ribose-5-phosphate isomerase RpiA [Sphingomonas sp. JC676]|uniref:ribose-5-phosphate isomerase RpiA n=1 Tax=Sphingomonas sp. JC676 TaxID=2768065 RepID=UPI0016586B3E|nr:ribose-5-phosphate isomerase RpiA [Sphingomonas sp. JC676]MBC9032169.1 ribose-5-phosphate isomerase RpiA [Sphingomonas sp. JC676]
MATPSIEDRKHAAAEAAVAEVASGMIVGLGTGTTAAHAIAALAARVSAGLAVDAVATSHRTAEAARAAGIRVIDFANVAAIDLCIDGVDEIDPQLRAIKGAGGAMLCEKIVASAAARMIAIADSSKDVAQLGAKPVPVEILPFAQAFLERRIERLGGVPSLRMAADGAAFRTDQNNMVLDCAFGPIADPDALATFLSNLPGLLGHGLFLREIDTIYLGTEVGVTRRDRRF